MSQGIVLALEELRRLIENHMRDTQARDQAFIQAIDRVLSQLGVKVSPTSTTPTGTTSTTPSTTTSTDLNKVILELSNQVKTLTNVMSTILEKGIPSRSYTNAVFMRLEGRYGITQEGRSFTLQEPADYIVVSPTVESIIGFNDMEPTDNIPPIIAGGQIAVGFKTYKINYRASTAVPASVLPAALYLWAFYY